ncbi:hypothetical protein RVR_4450 [Actinacidiphila reveromycinica]|uniref:Uncharacterized protein n=1 Tax=Actinacidiphila reveromycinica TaxID=659352 RepID=A0A7U3UTF0_9ACTN|nr:hypothetical protein [Streptomyces sp. SN-593]BBA98313.1 hypothetical protein RVR_4450 [Streptomyces sp. SN-593]
MATTDSPPASGYQPSDQLRACLAAWTKVVKETEPQARGALEAGIAQELRDDRQLTLNVLAQHLPWTAEMLRLLMANRDVPPRERHRQAEGEAPVYTLSERLRDLLAAWNLAVDDEKKARAELERCIADELKAHPALTNAEMAEHLPWSQEQVRVIARAHNVPRRRKRGSDHKLIEENGVPKAVTVPYDWYVQQPGADPAIVRR